MVADALAKSFIEIIGRGLLQWETIQVVNRALEFLRLGSALKQRPLDLIRILLQALIDPVSRARRPPELAPHQLLFLRNDFDAFSNKIKMVGPTFEPRRI